MGIMSNREYYAFRAVQERAKADVAACDGSRNSHLLMAQEYEAWAQGRRRRSRQSC